MALPTDAFISQCRQNYLNGLTPLNAQLTDAGYCKLADLMRQYLAQGWQAEFSGFLLEYQYYIDLWAALLLLKFGRPNEQLRGFCLYKVQQHFEKTGQPWPVGA